MQRSFLPCNLQSLITISWNNWTDDLSGISHFEYELTDIGYGTSALIKKESNISSVLDSVRKKY